MKKLIFAFMQAYGGDERESLLLVRSLRMFGGDMANNPIWLMVPQGLEQISESTRQTLNSLDVELISFYVPEKALKFPFGGKVYAASAAEALADSQADILVWMDSDTIFFGEPRQLLLKKNISLGYRPVMLKNISLLFDEPLNTFWDFIYKRCQTPMENLFPMHTTNDRVCIRPQFNAGVMSLRPDKNLLQSWRQKFEQIHSQSQLIPYYEENRLYQIFVHQSILSATLLSVLTRDDMHDMGPQINWPVFLDGEPLNDLPAIVTLRYDDYKFFEQTGWEVNLNLSHSKKQWLLTHL